MKAAIFAAGLLASAPASAMSLTSGDFADGQEIPLADVHPGCGGQNVSPALAWKGVPKTAKTLLLTMIDIDVKPKLWSHWIVVYLPPESTGLERGAKTLPQGAHAVASNFGDAAYDGPCPPEGSGVHHYRFTLWALPRFSDVPANASAMELQSALGLIAIDKAVLTGWVKR